MEKQSWKHMEADCLVNIFQRLGIQELFCCVPFVCKSWHKASLDPLCWRVLNFRDLDLMPWSSFSKALSSHFSFSFSGLLRLTIDRSQGQAVEIRFPLILSSLSDFVYPSNECPRLKAVSLPGLDAEAEAHVPEIVSKWKELEYLEMLSKPASFPEVVKQISNNCKMLAGIKMSGAVKREDTAAIVEYLPKLKYLDLSKSYLPREELLLLMDGCTELRVFRVCDCFGIDAEDAEIIEKGGGIEVFECHGSKLLGELGYETDECDPLNVVVIC